MKTKNKKYDRLKLPELQTIFLMRGSEKTIREIARFLKRSCGTVHKALRNYEDRYWSNWIKMHQLEKAWYVFNQQKANRQRSWGRGNIRDAVILKYVTEKLEEGYSPEAISDMIRQDLKGKRISYKTIYNFVKNNRGFKKYLYEKGKKRRQQVANRRGKHKKGAPLKHSVHNRPKEANKRERIGDLEIDTIVSCRGGSGAILSVIDRKTRRKWYRKIPNLKAVTVLGYLRAILLTMPPEFRKTFTFDNGSEFAYSEMIKLETFFIGLKCYYCDSYSSWQKGSVENSNRAFRRFFPKGTDFGSLTQAEVRATEYWINQRRMKCLKYKTPNELFNAGLPKAAAALAA